ncbi:MAG: GDSL-type esterase/lipase family protein [Bacteroidales bacterium]|nr:GDSL-type esterase/lipase family protein [Bacteroidales bacterium]
MRSLRLFILLTISTLTIFGQENSHKDTLTSYIAIDTLEFAHFDADTFAFSMDTSLLIHFFNKLDSAIKYKNESINILHIGGSHVQAGTMSHRIRKNLLNYYPDFIGGRGILFPYSAAKKCNNPADYKVNAVEPFGLTRNVYKELDRPLAVTGIAVYTDTIANIKITKRDVSLNFGTDSVIILGYADSSLIEPCLVINGRGYSPNIIDTARLRFIYNNIESITDSFTVHIEADTQNKFTLTGILLATHQPGLTFHSIGVNGASVPSYLKCTDFVCDLELLIPDMVIFGIGINDAAGPDFDTLAFEKQYLKLITEFKQVNPQCAFVFITNNDSYKKVGRGKYAVNRNGLLAQKVFYKLAAETAGAVWDQFDIMGGLKSMAQWQTHKLAQKDKIHFTANGYNLMGDLFFNAFVHAHEKVKSQNIE